ncbi:DNA-(apurinic or apyrimidinic site) lyase /endonuclease III [Succinivibrio dextrinosolvens]|uniref:endonuclease III n=1 Tax=Succinivibrio dextrinosolvens TaxID=83771 RepID=UPI0008F1359F|nr:endonuclease III [Succinivibrio dextrinosolvens]SFS85512.1 DNA-(apurinic or apyrimidinic site) lyase /endonuclease III [Succinivibrio dextrinosolvens]
MKKTISLLSDNDRCELLQILSECFPNPKSELVFSNPYELLCAVILSAQATDESVNKVTPQLFSMAPSPYKMVELGVDRISEVIRTIGLWRAKSKNIFEMSKILIDKYKGNVPCTYEALVSLPGVGSKTAKVVMNVAFGLPTIAVDTHIFRVCNRTGLCPGKTVKDVENNIVHLIDDKYMIKAHHLLLLHGRYVCKSRHPMCENCRISGLCKKLM